MPLYPIVSVYVLTLLEVFVLLLHWLHLILNVKARDTSASKERTVFVYGWHISLALLRFSPWSALSAGYLRSVNIVDVNQT